MRSRRVYIRGVGAITPLGSTWPVSVSALAEGKSAIGPVTHFDVKNFPCTVAATIAEGFVEVADRRLALARVAAREAWSAAAIATIPERTGIFLGAEKARQSLFSPASKDQRRWKSPAKAGRLMGIT